MYSYIRQELFPTDKNSTLRLTFNLKLLIVLLSVTAFGVFLKSGTTEWLQFQDQSLYESDQCFSKDNLFRYHLKSSVKPFLSAKTKLSEDAFKWWKRMQNEQGNFSYYEKTVNEIFEIFPTVPDLGKPDSNSRITCAVVGNSLNLKGSNYGPLIDSKDIIIRMNFGPIKGYEEDVGTKTTHHVMYPESAVDLDNSTHLVLIPFKILDLEWLIGAFTTGFYGRLPQLNNITHDAAFNRSYAPVKGRIQANKDLVIVVSPAFMKYVHKIWLEEKGGYPSTGFITLVFALNICDEISVFGYGADSNGQWSHYFETMEDKNFKTGKHPGQEEYEILQLLDFENIVKLYQGM